MKVPLIRIGITLAIGSVAASAIQFYLAIASTASDLNSDLPATTRGAGDWFVKDFLFQGTIPTALFWIGIGIAIVGIVVMAVRPTSGQRRAAMANAAIAAAIQDFARQQGQHPPAGPGGPGPQPPQGPPPPDDPYSHSRPPEMRDNPGHEKW